VTVLFQKLKLLRELDGFPVKEVIENVANCNRAIML
jgi:hypothetical protein